MRPPHFWSAGLDPYSRESAPLVRFLLSPLAGLYSWVGARRISKTTPTQVDAHTICVGNLTSGGSGKTPVVAALRDLLTQRGIEAISLSRGYGGARKNPTMVDPHNHTAREVGDEPLLLAETGEAWIGRDKVETAREICAGRRCVIILDDGHQNPTLLKDTSLVVIDAGAPFGNGYVIPKGPLREPIARGLERADGIILMGDGEVPDPVVSSGLPVFRAALEQITPIPAGPLIAFAGIGRPERFYEHINRQGGNIRDTLSFADHHVYSRSEIKRLHDFATVHNAGLVTTEKDYIRLSKSLRDGITPLKVRAMFDAPDRLLGFLGIDMTRDGS